jgi:hypothetical protein
MLKKLKITAVLLIIFALFVSFLPSANLGAAAVDYSGFWGIETIAIMIERGVIEPDDAAGNVRPDRAITRAEVASAINKNFDFTRTTSINYTDVSPSDWFYRDLQIARQVGYMIGDADGGFRPNANISREELSTVIGRILALPGGAEFARNFTDHTGISSWALDFVGAMARENILIGYPNGEFRPWNNVTRAEAYTILLRSAKVRTANANGKLNTASASVDSNVSNREYLDLTVTRGGVTLENITVNGDLIIAASVGNGSVTLRNVTVAGITYIRGGGTTSVNATDSRLGDVIINSAFNTRLTLNGTQTRDSVGRIIAASGATIDNRHTRLRPNISVAGGIPSRANVNIIGDVNNINVNASANVNLDGKSRELNISGFAAGVIVSLSDESVVDNANIDVSSATVSGGGVITNARLTQRSSGVNLNVSTTNVARETADGASLIQLNFQSLTSETVSGANTTLLAVFDRDIPGGLTAGDIRVRGATFVSVSPVTGSLRNYNIVVSNISASGVSVTIQKPGFNIRNATRTIADTNVVFTSLTPQNGAGGTTSGSATSNTTILALSFDRDITGGLAPENISVTRTDSNISAATVVAVHRTNQSLRNYTVEIAGITVADNTDVRVTVTKTGFTFTGDPNTTASRIVRIRKMADVTFSSLARNGLPAGSSGLPTETTTTLTLTFSGEIPNLTASNITVTGASRGTLTQSSTNSRVYSLNIFNITVEDNESVRIGVVRPDLNILSPVREIAVRKTPDTHAAFIGLTMTDSGTQTQLTLTFDKVISGLTAADITVQNATKGNLIQHGINSNVYILNISNIVNPSQSITVTPLRSGITFAPPWRAATSEVTSVTIFPPAHTANANPTLERGRTHLFTATVQGAGNPSQTVSWWINSIGQSQLTQGTFIEADGRLTISNSQPAGTFIVIAQSTVNSSITERVTVTVGIPPTITGATGVSPFPQSGTVTLPAGTVGTPYSSVTLGASGTPTPTWRLVTGANLPDGLTFSAGGISGTPTRADTFTFTVEATNTFGTATRQFTIVIASAAVNKTALEAELKKANDAITAGGYVESTNGVGVATGFWVTQAEINLLDAAIETANSVIADTSATQTAVTNALNALNSALIPFTTSKKQGSCPTCLAPPGPAPKIPCPTTCNGAIDDCAVCGGVGEIDCTNNTFHP